MEGTLKHHLQDYLQAVFGLGVALDGIDVTSVPFYLRERYFLGKLEFLDHSFLFFGPRGSESVSPGIIRKDAGRLREILNVVPVWVASRIATYERRKLIEYRIPFIVPGTQTYLPDLLLDLREHFQRERRQSPAGRFSPAAQHILLRAIYKNAREIDGLIHQEPEDGNYSAMTFSRAVGEFQEAGLVETEQRGRNRRAWFTLPWREVWEKALPRLRNPVRRRLFIDQLDILLDADLPRAGLSALSEYSMLNPPGRPVYAAVNQFSLAGPGRNPTFSGKKSRTELEASHRDEAEAELELWVYRPLDESGIPGCVDPLSLYLSLQEESDERTRKALDDLLKQTRLR
ncbi:hypothetical protein OpiT1DRAFT_00728 [Opitutaceae bacterium TAV1]|nr:hypothetical protein OpiT1DRAFT_00728 [Opitutaceae bacterium TAV1]